MKRVGTADIPADACGFSATPDSAVCGKQPVLHAWIDGTWEGVSFGMACDEHAPVLRYVADKVHDVEGPCFGTEGYYWLDRPDGTSFCYHPETEAELEAELAAGSTVHSRAAS